MEQEKQEEELDPTRERKQQKHESEKEQEAFVQSTCYSDAPCACVRNVLNADFLDWHNSLSGHREDILR